MVKNIKNLIQNLVERYYLIVLIVSFLTMFNINFFAGAIITTLSFFFSIKILLFQNNKIWFKSLIVFFILYNVLSGFNYFLNNLPIKIYFSEIQLQIIPIFFFFIGFNKRNSNNRMYNYTLYGTFFMCLIGLFLYIEQPDWYIEWRKNGLIDWVGNINVDSVILNLGLSSFFYTPYYTGYLSLISIIILLDLIYKNGFTIYYFLLFLLFSLTLLLSQMRVAWLFFVLLVFFTIIYWLIKKPKKGLFFLGIIFLIFSIFIFILKITLDSSILDILFERLYSTSSVVSERSSTWNIEIKNLFDLLFGHGLGSASHQAHYLGFSSITDGQYFKILYELGIFGFFLFLTIIFFSLIRGFKYFNYYFIEVLIILFFVFANVGANPLSMPIIIAIFWFSLGRIWNLTLLRNYMFKFNQNHISNLV